MTPKVKISETVFPDSSKRHRGTFHGQIWWKSAVAKLPKGRLNYHTKKKLALPETRPTHHFAQNGPITPKIPWTLSPHVVTLTCPCIPNLVQIGCVFPDLVRKDWFFGPKSQSNIGFQPTIIIRFIKRLKPWLQRRWWQRWVEKWKRLIETGSMICYDVVGVCRFCVTLYTL